ncbi:hypothetical protein AALO_G00139310 [Alosa alosa]|uniref:Solute carrier family 2, facilitated glucose transporter member 10 n=1 Tax=Alosa alosa TaxID=278164 RepID=A0AAV6GIH0_9TELE|nr:solute carrier family 2, facilitated glucose transporter member 10 isoform X1 [Alosa alosa]KAG5274710.1 hypothetical protein AALO_G00139310 [Alosa alosa]
MGCPTPMLAASVSTLGGLVFGYELGIISGALLQLKTQFHLGCVQQETIVSALLMGAFCASLIGGWLIDRRGRRNSILLSCVLVIAGTSLMSTGGFFAILVTGRAITGFAICISSMSCCIFVSEMVPPKRRGLMVTLYEVGITVGILKAFSFNYILTDVPEGWRYMFGFAMVPTMLQLISIWFLRSKVASAGRLSRESHRGLVEEAGTEVPGEVHQEERQAYSTWCLFQSKDNMRTRTCIGLGLVLFQQFTGQPNVLLYASTIFHTLGFQSTDSAVLASLGLGIVKVLTTLASTVCADRAGRRPLLIGGSAMMAVGLLVIGFLSGSSVLDARRPCSSPANATLNTYGNASLIRSLPASGTPQLSADPRPLTQLHAIPVPTEAPGGTDQEAVNWVILISMMAVVSAFSVGFGPMTWLVLSEIFPAGVRGRAFAFINCFNWAAHLIVTFSFLNVLDVMGMSGIFLMYGAIAVASTVFIFFMLPETKGKSLQQIDRELSEKRFHDRSDCFRRITRVSSPGYQRVCSISNSSV